MIINHYIERDGQEISVEVGVRVTPAYRSARDSLCGILGAGPALEPDEPATAEIESVFPEIELSAEEAESIRIRALEEAFDSE